MPRATDEYRFEWMILQWAWTLSRTFTGDTHYPFLLLFNAGGVADRLVFGSAPETHDSQEWQQIRENAHGRAADLVWHAVEHEGRRLEAVPLGDGSACSLNQPSSTT